MFKSHPVITTTILRVVLHQWWLNASATQPSCTQKDLEANLWWHTESVNQLNSPCHGYKKVHREMHGVTQKTFMHEKQPVSTTQQLHRHQWTTDLSFLKGRGGSIGAFSIVNNEDKVLLHSRVSATDYGLTFVQSKSNLHCRKPRIHYSHQKTCGICHRLQRLGSVVHVGNHALPMKHKNNWNKVLRSARDVCLSPSVPLCYLE